MAIGSPARPSLRSPIIMIEDIRAINLRRMESEIQKRAGNKDKKFRLEGKWKVFLRRQDHLRVYQVDGEWIRSNLSVIFGWGGHGYIHEFIPLGEIWVTDFNNMEHTIKHEITEYRLMQGGTSYETAHKKACEVEKET